MKSATTLLGGCVASLLALGLVILYSAKMGPQGEKVLGLQLMWCGLGLVVCAVAALADYRWLKKLALPLLLLAVALLVLVLIPGVGIKVNGARRWLGVGPARFQPSELAKLALVVFLAWYGSRYHRHMPTFLRGLVLPGLIVSCVLPLIFLEPDWGTTILLAAVSGGVLWLAGLRLLYLVPPVALAMAGLCWMVINDPVRLARVKAYLDQEGHKEGVGYQVHQAKIALGAGGWQGLGLGNGRQKMGFIPEHHTDFILSVIGEEAGAAATLAVVTAYVLIVLCGAFIAWHATDAFGFLLASGLTLVIGLQASINIGVVTGVLPNKGLPLPFISSGGSNLLIMLASVGLLFSIARFSGTASREAEVGLTEPEPSGLPF